MPKKLSPERNERNGGIQYWKAREVGDRFRGIFHRIRPVVDGSGNPRGWDEACFTTSDGNYTVSGNQIVRPLADMVKGAAIEIVATGWDDYDGRPYLTLDVWQYQKGEDFEPVGPIDAAPEPGSSDDEDEPPF